MRARVVEVGDVITAINGQPMLGYDTSVVANALQTLPACVTLRLVKYGFDFVPVVAQTQVCYRQRSCVLADGVECVRACLMFTPVSFRYLLSLIAFVGFGLAPSAGERPVGYGGKAKANGTRHRFVGGGKTITVMTAHHEQSLRVPVRDTPARHRDGEIYRRRPPGGSGAERKLRRRWRAGEGKSSRRRTRVATTVRFVRGGSHLDGGPLVVRSTSLPQGLQY